MRAGVTLAVLLLSGCVPKTARVRPALAAEAPELFFGLRWTTDLGARFPGAELGRTEYSGLGFRKLVVTSANGVELEPFGPVHVELVGEPDAPASMFVLSTADPRPQCYGGVGPSPSRCRNEYSSALVSIYGQLRTSLTRHFGAPQQPPKAEDSDPAMAAHPKERTTFWKVPGAKVYLSLQLAEFDGWSVMLQALRDGAPL